MRLLLATLLLAIAFVFITGSSLPPVVASHFVAGGAANGFMPRATYLRFTIALLVGLPLLIALLANLTSLLPARFVNLPNREYWLAPERRADTLVYLRKHGTRFGVMLATFLGFVHWLVVQANAHIPPLFPEALFFIGMAAFLLCVVIWLGWVHCSFSPSPRCLSKGVHMTDTNQTAYLAGGCFWGMEDLVRKIPGVVDTEVGYTGGDIPNATYDTVKTGRSGHAESLKIVFDPKRLTYRHLLFEFFRMHNPTTRNQQGNDIGTQYRSAIFYLNEEQKRTAEEVIKTVDASGEWKANVVTEVVPFKEFWRAEEYHQRYLYKNPGGYTCHYVRKMELGEAAG